MGTNLSPVQHIHQAAVRAFTLCRTKRNLDQLLYAVRLFCIHIQILLMAQIPNEPRTDRQCVNGSASCRRAKKLNPLGRDPIETSYEPMRINI